MKTLVLKCQESVSNSSLREMNELRLKIISQETGESKTIIKPLQDDGTYKGTVNLRVLSGTGYFVNSAGTSKGTSWDYTYSASNPNFGVIVPSGESVVQIKNFDLITDILGNEATAFASVVTTGNFPKVIVDMKELREKTFLKKIRLGGADAVCFDDGDISNLAKLTELVYLSGLPKTSKGITGDLSSLSNLKQLETFKMTQYNLRLDVSFSLNDLVAMTALSHCTLQGGTFKGGDIYTFLSAKSYVDFELERNDVKLENATCSYVSGTSDIPKFTLKQLQFGTNSINGASYVDKVVAKALLTLIKDGINAHTSDSSTGITLETGATIILGLTESSDTALNTLKSEVEALGVTVTFRT